MRACHRIVAAGTAALMVASAAGCDAFAGEAVETVLVGVSLNLTGAGNDLDAVYHDALQLELERVTERELARGRQLELLVRDNRGDTGTAVAQLAELAADPQVTAIITGSCGECAVVAAETLTAARVATISLAPTSDVATPVEERRYLFKVGPDAADAADRFSDEITRTGAATLGLVTTDDPYGREGALGMREAAGRDRVEIVAHQWLPTDAGESDVAAAVAAVAGWAPPPDPVTGQVDPQLGPDAVVLWLRPQPAVEVGTGLRRAGYDGPLFVDILAVEDKFLQPGMAALADAKTVFSRAWEADRSIAASLAAIERKVWHRDYLARYGTIHPPAVWAADALRVVAIAVGRATTPDRATVHTKVESTLFDGITGQIRITADQHSGVHPTSLDLLTAWR